MVCAHLLTRLPVRKDLKFLLFSHVLVKGWMNSLLVRRRVQVGLVDEEEGCPRRTREMTGRLIGGYL